MTAEQAIAKCLYYSKEQRTILVDHAKVLFVVQERDRQQFEAGWQARGEADKVNLEYRIKELSGVPVKAYFDVKRRECLMIMSLLEGLSPPEPKPAIEPVEEGER